MARFGKINRNKDSNSPDLEFDNGNDYKDTKNEIRNIEQEKEPDFMNISVKRFRTLIGAIALAAFIGFLAFGGSSDTKYMSNITSGKVQGVKAGDILTSDDVKLASKDFTVNTANSDGGPIQLQIWDFGDEDGDYVQVFVDGQPKTEPFAIRHRITKINVPGKGLIQVKGIRDGNGKGITYGVFFNKTGETYLNTVPLNASNTYTIKTAK